MYNICNLKIPYLIFPFFDVGYIHLIVYYCQQYRIFISYGVYYHIHPIDAMINYYRSIYTHNSSDLPNNIYIFIYNKPLIFTIYILCI